MSTWKTPLGAPFATIKTYPPPTAIPLVFLGGVVTVLSSLPFQSTSHASSVRDFGSARGYVAAWAPDSFCPEIHNPSGVTAIPLGNPLGHWNSLVVFAFRPEACLGGGEPLFRAGAGVCSAKAIVPFADANPAAIPVRNSRLVTETSLPALPVPIGLSVVATGVAHYIVSPPLPCANDRPRARTHRARCRSRDDESR